MRLSDFKKDCLKNRSILITGASKGIGKTLALSLSKHGANVIMLARNEKEMDAIYDEIKENYRTEPCILKCDLENLNDSKSNEIANIINENYKYLDAIIFNAAVLEKVSNIESYDTKTWDKVLRINLTSSFILCKRLIPMMKVSPMPRIIFTTSGVGKKAKAFWGAYSVSKAGVNALSEILADELDSTSNIKLFNFNPKATQSDMRSIAYPAEDPSLLKEPKDLIKYYLWMLSKKSNLSRINYIEYGDEHIF